MDFVTVSTGLILPYWMGLPIRYIHIKKGNIGLLYLHNSIMILNEDKDSYCRMIGRGLMIMGLGALISSLLSACLNNENYLFILLASSVIGVTMCYYAVFKYNMYRKIQS